MSDIKNLLFATAINCIDGRVQEPVIKFLKEKYGVAYVDMITEPGPEKVLSVNIDFLTIEALRKKVEISLFKHDSKLVSVVGRYDCAGNPVDKDEQVAQILTSLTIVKSWGYECEVIGLWVDENREVTQID
ncbi:MAG: hypothetical protein DDT22_00465 [candidate division WS2 bacterium]|nr:hypothetical protein [Candidatus Lithacetigena glycinireducens]